MQYLIVTLILLSSLGCVSSKQHMAILAEQGQQLLGVEKKLQRTSEIADSLDRALLFSQGGNALLLEAHGQLQDRLVSLEEEQKKLQHSLSNTQQDLSERLAILEAEKQELQQAQAAFRRRFQAALTAFSQVLDSIGAAWQKDTVFQQITIKSQPGGLSVHIPEEMIFQENSQRILPQASLYFERIAAVLQQNARWNVSILGHTDKQERRRPPNNWAYSADRAVVVAQELAENHYVSTNRISAVGKGDSNPLQSNATAEGRAANRRIEFYVSNSLAYLMKTLRAISEE